MKQVFVIHGGNAFDTYEEYITYLKAKKVSLEDLHYSDWKHLLQENLGEDYQVLQPRMPNGNNAKYLEWKIYFEKFIPLLSDAVIFVGHSLGGIFLAKYLSEEKYPKRIAATLLVAAPFNTISQHPLADFNIKEDLSLLKKQGGQIILYHSKDDAVVPFSNFENYGKALPSAKQQVFENLNHLNQEQFPELVKDIQSI
jgi:predicted alpha/beta hydrolase family esterase